jgi:hypothetical protein
MQFAQNLGAGWRETTSKKLKDLKYFPLDISELDIAYLKDHGKPVPPSINTENVTYNPILTQEDSDKLKQQLTDLQDHEYKHLLYKAHMRKHFIDTDLRLIKDNSDALIVYYDESARRGAGTVSEAQYAYNLNIPIFLVAEYESIEDMHKNISGWLIALATKVFTNFDDLYTYLENLPYGIIKKDIYGNHGIDNEYLCHLSGNTFEKKKHKFVSQVHPLYSQKAVHIVNEVYEKTKDRYEFFMEYLTDSTGTKFNK